MILSAQRIVFGDRTIVPSEKAVCFCGAAIDRIDSLDALRALYPHEEVVSFPGCTVLPGLIDLHVHFNAMPDNSYYAQYNATSLCALYTAGRMRDTLARGVTTVRDAYSSGGIGTALKQATAEGFIQAPRIFACLQGICMTGGHGSDSLDGGVIEADGVEAIRAAVRLNCKRGADCIKVLTSDGYRGVELNQTELDAAVDEAHRLGRKAFAHAGYGASIEMCIRAGFDSIEHGTHLTVEQAKRMRDNDQTWVPTAYVFQYVYRQMQSAHSDIYREFEDESVLRYLKDSVDTYEANLRALYDTGVRVATGTDIDYVGHPEPSPVAGECARLVECGLTPLEAIECATKNGADFLGMDNLGRVAEGCIADLLVVEGDPSRDISALSQVRAVFQSGKRII